MIKAPIRFKIALLRAEICWAMSGTTWRMFSNPPLLALVAFMLTLTMAVPLFICSDSSIVGATTPSKFEPTWSSLNRRPIPAWWTEGKFGIFVHWGVFSVPAFRCGDGKSEWFWWYLRQEHTPCVNEFFSKRYGANSRYTDLVNGFHAIHFDPIQWADLFARSGARWVVFTSKHHEGFANWPSADAWPWTSSAAGPHRDLVGELATAVRSKGMRFGIYHSLLEWFHPLYLEDEASGFHNRSYVTKVVAPMLKDVVERYKPSVVWSDGDWTASDEYWQSKEFLVWLYNESSVRDQVVVNDRWGNTTRCHDGGFYTCADNYDPHSVVKHPWENAFTIQNNTWGFDRTASIDEYLTLGDILKQFASTVAYGGNILLNVGPEADGIIPPVFQERLLQLGSWLEINGNSVYGSKPWSVSPVQHSLHPSKIGDIYYSWKEGVLYAILLEPYPLEEIILTLVHPIGTAATQVVLLGDPQPNPLEWWPALEKGDPGIVIRLPSLIDPSSGAWVFSISHEGHL